MMMMMRYGSMYVFVIRLQVSWDDDDLGVFVRLCMYFGVCGGGVRSIIMAWILFDGILFCVCACDRLMTPPIEIYVSSEIGTLESTISQAMNCFV